MAEVGQQRRGHGADRWWIFQDAADPSRFIETWIEPTWAEHSRYHERVSVACKEVERRARDLVRSGSTITTRHFIALVRRPSADAALRAAEVWT